MSILIKGMTFPKDGAYLATLDISVEDGYAIINIPNVGTLNLLELPEPHGRLIDAPEIEWEAVGGGEKEISLGALIALAHKVDNAPTVIEAEGQK